MPLSRAGSECDVGMADGIYRMPDRPGSNRGTPFMGARHSSGAHIFGTLATFDACAVYRLPVATVPTVFNDAILRKIRAYVFDVRLTEHKHWKQRVDNVREFH